MIGMGRNRRVAQKGLGKNQPQLFLADCMYAYFLQHVLHVHVKVDDTQASIVVVAATAAAVWPR